MQRRWGLGLGVLLCGAGVFAADAAPSAPPLKSTAEWVAQLGSDTFNEREAAVAALKALGAEAEAPVKKALDSPDAEVRRRAAWVLAALTPVDFSGEFVRIGSESFEADGSAVAAINEMGTATLVLNTGRAVLTQNYSSMKVSQTYTFAPETKLALRGGGMLKVLWKEINQFDNYYPDSGEPRLTFENTPNGPRVIFQATDTRGTKVKMLFARQADINKDPALKAALDAEAKALLENELLFKNFRFQ